MQMSNQNMGIGNERVIKQPDAGDSADFGPCWDQFASINNITLIIFIPLLRISEKCKLEPQCEEETTQGKPMERD